MAPIKNQAKKTLLIEARVVINLYEVRGFIITKVEADREFACITSNLLPAALNIADAEDQVHKMER